MGVYPATPSDDDGGGGGGEVVWECFRLHLMMMVVRCCGSVSGYT